MHPPSTPMSAQHKLLLPLLTVLHAPGFASSNQACRLKASALPRFRYETMYGWHASMANFTPQSQSSSITEIVDFHNATRRPGILELQGVFFQDMKKSHPTLRGQMVKPTAIADWEALLPKIKPLIAQKIIIGFMLGDEIVWNNVSWVDLDAIATRVKGDCPEPFLFYNEGGAPLWGNYNVNHMHTEYPHIPAAVDYVSTDDYDTINIGGYNATQIKRISNAPWQYKRYLYPKLLKHQKVFVIPPIYNISFPDCHGPGKCKGEEDGVPQQCPPLQTKEALDACILNQTIGYLRWIEDDEKIVGIDAFHLGSYGQTDTGLVDLPQSLACYATLGAQLLGAQPREHQE